MGFAELEAWSRIAHVPLSLWTCESIRAVSGAFLSARNTLRDEDAVPPWMPPGARERLAQQLAEFERDFGALAVKSR